MRSKVRYLGRIHVRSWLVSNASTSYVKLRLRTIQYFQLARWIIAGLAVRRQLLQHVSHAVRHVPIAFGAQADGRHEGARLGRRALPVPGRPGLSLLSALSLYCTFSARSDRWHSHQSLITPARPSRTRSLHALCFEMHFFLLLHPLHTLTH